MGCWYQAHSCQTLSLGFVGDRIQSQNFGNEGFTIKGLRWAFFCRLEMQELSINLLLTPDVRVTGRLKAGIIAYTVYYALWVAELFLVVKISRFRFAIRRVGGKPLVVKAEDLILVRNKLSVVLLVLLEKENPICINGKHRSQARHFSSRL